MRMWKLGATMIKRGWRGKRAFGDYKSTPNNLRVEEQLRRIADHVIRKVCKYRVTIGGL